MKKKYFLFLTFLLCFQFSSAQVFEVETIQYKGSSDKFINIVIMGDGYTASQQDLFITKATDFANSLTNITPWSNYKNYFNIYAIKVISNESGAIHPNTASDCNTANPPVPVSNPDNYFKTQFDYAGIHRLIVPTSDARIASVLAANVPDYDQLIIIANSSDYGGSGGSYATTTTHPAGVEITAHEMGHSFANLADEYYAGDQYFFERPNMTAQSNPATNKWRNWLTTGTGISIQNYCCGGNSASWYKPTTNSCKMEILGVPYCAVCKEGIIERVHSLVNPIVAYEPETLNIESTQQFLNFNLSELMLPVPNTLNIKWQLDGAVLSNTSANYQLDQTTLTNGIHTLSATVTDDTTLIRVDNHAAVHASIVTWNINKTSLGINAVASDSQISYAVYPNPASNVATIELDLQKNSTISVDLISADGKVLQHLKSKTAAAGKYKETINIEKLASGTYFIAVKIDGVVHSKTLVKE